MNSLADLFPSLLHALGVNGESNRLEISESSGREAVLLLDGLGSEQLRDYASVAPFLASLQDSHDLRATFPSTTATSLASLGVGAEPHIHGMFGYSVKVPNSGEPPRILNALKWDDRVNPETWQPSATAFQRAVAAGVSAVTVGASHYENSGLTQAALRGSVYFGVDKKNSFIEQAQHAMRDKRTLGYLYLNDLDVIGHAKGVGSPEWIKVLTTLDLVVEELARVLPSETRLWITGDHGMINVSDVIDMGELPGVEDVVIAGEGRMRHVYTTDAHDLVLPWQEVLGERVEIVERNQAIDAGWFGGPVPADFIDRIGDLLLLPEGNDVLINPARPKEAQMIGHHGGRSSAELGVPLRVAVAGLR